MATVACGSGTPATPESGGPASPAALSPTALPLPRCGKPPSPAPGAAPAGAIVPPGTTLTAVRDQPPITQLNGYVEMTPVQVREWVEARDDLVIKHAEDEGFESELLVTAGDHSIFVKAQAVCATASLLAEVIAPAGADAALPTPAGGTPAP